MIDKFEIKVTKKVMEDLQVTKGTCTVCSVSDEDRGFNITEIQFRGMTISVCDHHKNILIQKLTSDNSRYEAH